MQNSIDWVGGMKLLPEGLDLPTRSFTKAHFVVAVLDIDLAFWSPNIFMQLSLQWEERTPKLHSALHG